MWYYITNVVLFVLSIVYVGELFMYLLMLLATFISAIYGYNLSARPDYDRDVAKKKAMSVVYKFLFQEKNAVALLGRVNRGTYKGTDYALEWAMPGDLIYADYDNSQVSKYNEDTTLFYKQSLGGASSQPFYLRKAPGASSKVDNVTISAGKEADDYLEAGRRLFDGSEMVTKVVCLDEVMYKPGAKLCEPTPKMDPTGTEIIGYVNTCCNRGFNYVVSYKKLDSRWVNRIHTGISLDFMNSVVDRDYTDNIGVIHWDGDKKCKASGGGEDTGCWTFQGKINFLPVFAEDMEEWESHHINEDGTRQYYPAELRNRSTWDLPKNVFDRHFFKNKNGRNICELGCLFKVKMF
jgi:hypothetical protein